MATKTVKRLLDKASRALADFRNSMIFGHSCPVSPFAATPGVAGDSVGLCLLESIPRHSFLSVTSRPPGLPSSRASTRHTGSCKSQLEC